MWSASNKTMTYEQTKKDADMAKKDLKIVSFFKIKSDMRSYVPNPFISRNKQG